MAKKKKKKISPASKPVENKEELKQASPGAESSPKTPPAPAPSQTKHRQVSLATCVAGMFLCLALGVYLGTLVPLMTEEPSSPPIPPEIPMNTTVSPVAEKPSLSGLNPEQNKKLANLLEATSRSPDNARLWAELGNLYFDAHAFEDAIKAYEKSLSVNPNAPDVLTDLGIMYRETEQFEKAIANFRKASAIDPTHQNSLYNEGIVFATDLHNVEEAARAWEKLLKINPDARSPEGTPVVEQIKKLGK